MVYVVVGWAGACVCVCMRESLLPQEVVWMGSFVCRRHRAFTHSAKQAGWSPAESSTWPLWWNDAQTHDTLPRVGLRARVCAWERERGDVCGVFVHMRRCAGVQDRFAHMRCICQFQLVTYVEKLALDNFKYESTKHNWLDYVDQTAAFLCFCGHMVT